MSHYSMELTDRKKNFAGQFHAQADTFGAACTKLLKEIGEDRQGDIWCAVITCTVFEPTLVQQAEAIKAQIEETKLKLEGLRDQLKRVMTL